MLSEFTAVARQIAATTKKTEKELLLAAYFREVDDATLERAAVFFAGSPFPSRDERVTGVGWATIADAAAAAIGSSREEMAREAVRLGTWATASLLFFL